MAAPASSSRRCTYHASVAACVLIGACGDDQSPETQVRTVIERGEAAAEARDLSGLMALVADDYQDDSGRDRRELRQYVHGYLIANQSIRLLTRVDRIEFPYRDMARVDLTLGSVGREAAGNSFDLAADVQQLSIELQLDDGVWKVTRARLESNG